MVDSGCDGYNLAAFNCAPKDSWACQSMNINQFAYKLVQVEGDASFISATEDELIGVEHLLAEPEAQKSLDGDAMYVGSESTEKCLAIEAFPSTFDYYNSQDDYSILDAVALQAAKQDSKYEFVDSMLKGVDEEDNLQLTYNLSSACSDYLLGAQVDDRTPQLACGSQNESSTQKLGSECQSYSMERDLDLGDLMPVSTPGHNALFLDTMSIVELQDAFRSMFGRDTCVRDKHWLMRRILFGFQNVSEFGNVPFLVESGFSSMESEINMILPPENDLLEGIYRSCQGGVEDEHAVDDVRPAISKDERVVAGLLGEPESTPTTSKRLRKPTRRYIEETSEMEPRCTNERVKAPFSSSDDKLVHAGENSQMPCALRSRRGFPRKITTFRGINSGGSKEHTQHRVVPKRGIASRLSDSDSEYELSDDSDISTRKAKSGIRRQHHKQWMVSEVMQLIEGVSEFGVGRWTEIKKRFFSASVHRTAVDLKDKWRNLLRASGAQFHGKKKVKPQKHMTVLIPPTALQRVRELSIIHPYPRERKTRLPFAAAPSRAKRNHD